ncbi:MAG: addiction module toxin RelE [Candidatus Woesearchaeota archaeon]
MIKIYSFDISKNLDNILSKLAKKNPKRLQIIRNKIKEVIINPYHYKNLRNPLQHLKRVHVDKSFVLIFSVNENEKKVLFEEFDHHDNIYK